ncbi:MAG: SRPBCC family protein [Betaproteobacteria bacterium]|nr:SRPBCC family protein [Betaproteobacteria bacterium]
MLYWIRPRLLLVLLWLLPTGAEAVSPDDIEIRIQVDGAAVHADVSLTVSATPPEVWAVLTDFAHMPEFISNLSSSQVLSREGNLLTVAQKGKASVGPLSFEFESVREIRLSPFELIRTRQLSGNLKRFEGTTELILENGRTRIHHHSDSISNVWIPPLIGPKFITSETREQFTEMRQEILRRKHALEKP